MCCYIGIVGEKSADYITVKVNGKIEGVYSLADDQEIRAE